MSLERICKGLKVKIKDGKSFWMVVNIWSDCKYQAFVGAGGGQESGAWGRNLCLIVAFEMVIKPSE